MTFDERVRALATLGFTERQTRFLVTVALHGGFCLRRQYMAFAGLEYGAGVRDFLDRLVTRRLATRFNFRADRGHVYHLQASAIYDPIGQPDNRNRRNVSAALIARKLMILDFVLANPHVEWLGTEEDKVDLFATHFGVPAFDLPQRVYVSRSRDQPPTIRYFIHKLPISANEGRTVVSLAWLVSETSGQAFEQFLHDHVPLLSCLPYWRVIAAAPRHIPGLPACAPAVSRVAQAFSQPRTMQECEALRAYYTMLERIERNDLRDVTLAQIQAFQKTRAPFGGNTFEVLFHRWKAHGDAILADRRGAGFLAAIREGRGQLVTAQLAHSYDRFGTLAGVS